jgi:6,7-dimethyl-8-ribityllumazine synthase
MTKVLIIEARFYERVSNLLLTGAKAALKKNGVEYEVFTVLGALEIPAVIAMAADKFDGFVALGCVERGETYHFEVVANESARGIMDLTLKGIAIGNGILTVETEAQAIIRADEDDKGGFAARACLELIKAKKQYGC